jgi:hypothetical protein
MLCLLDFVLFPFLLLLHPALRPGWFDVKEDTTMICKSAEIIGSAS